MLRNLLAQQGGGQLERGSFEVLGHHCIGFLDARLIPSSIRGKAILEKAAFTAVGCNIECNTAADF